MYYVNNDLNHFLDNQSETSNDDVINDKNLIIYSNPIV